MKIQIKNYHGVEQKDLILNEIKKCITNRLYVNGWSLRNIYLSILSPLTDDDLFDKIQLITVYEDGNENPIAVLLYSISGCSFPTFFLPKNAINVFVKRKYRKNGIGKQMIDIICQQNEIETNKVDVYTIYSGVEGSFDFYQKCISKYADFNEIDGL